MTLLRPRPAPDESNYKRPTAIENQIQAVSSLPFMELRKRLLVTDIRDPGYLRHECLVYLVRKGTRNDDQSLIAAVFSVLLTRCEANLRTKVPDGRIPNAAHLRDEILGEFAELFAVDGPEGQANELDFFECKFNLAFKTLRIDAVRKEIAHLKHVAPLPEFETVSEPDSYEDAFARVSDDFKSMPTQEWDVMRAPFADAIDALPLDEREAIILVHGLGYKEESDDPNVETAATRCKCTGRTIRNRLTRAALKLVRFKEEL